MVRFVIVGDIGQAGEGRTRVARAIAQLQPALEASFVIATGDNIYGDPDEAAFTALKEEMLDRVPLPWFFTLGNHDIKAASWHISRNGLRMGGWEWWCPASMYSVNAVWKARGGTPLPIDLLVINTNKHYKKVAEGKRWWHDQKKWVRGMLSGSEAGWKVVVGHHPIEYIPLGALEHGLPVVRYFSTTFMKGGATSRAKKASIRDAITEKGDLYICGHQHLMAHLVRIPSPKVNASCEYCIVGCSSKTEQDEEDFSEECSSSSSSSSSSSGGLLGKLKGKLKKKAESSSESSKAYSTHWAEQGYLGFAVADVTPTELTLTYYALTGETPKVAYQRVLRK